MKALEIRPFVPSKDYQASISFYQAKGFNIDKISDDLALCTMGSCGFYLQKYFNQEFAENLMLQLSVFDISEFADMLRRDENKTTRYQPIKEEPWGKVIYLWGPVGELWHITEFNP